VKRPILKGIGGFFLPLTACIDSLQLLVRAVLEATYGVLANSCSKDEYKVQ
jgi:hypothetical protein